MLVAEIKFHARSRELMEELVDAVWSYARELRDTGQIAGGYSVSRKGARVRLLCVIPEPSSLEIRFLNSSGRKGWRHVVKLTKAAPVVKVTGESDGTPAYCSCAKRSAAYLFTTFLDVATPLMCGNCRGPIPFYRLRGLTRNAREGILSWRRVYQACDDLFIHSGFGERWGYRQLSRLDSGLTRDGLELRAQLESELKLPVFYYLIRYWGRGEAAESRRRCPGCGGAWLLDKKEGCFEFRCVPCRLLSARASA
ncbi:MAG: hypothetical protein EBS05_05310 [Proteobacteria bacterium]|nr:hypothetical protein [Pseudomonadota bacterium]